MTGRGSLATAALAVVVLGACAQPGDFGRPKETVLSAWVSPLQGPTQSGFPFTDDEQELRARAWRFLMPAKERWFLDKYIHDAARVGLIPEDQFPETLTWYKEALLADAIRSPSSMFARLAVDASADRALIVAFAATAARVIDADRIRVKAMLHAQGLVQPEIDDANIRMRENAGLIGWVCYRMARRARSYRHALEHLFIAAPQAEAVGAERAVMSLERDLGVLKALGCVRDDPFRGIAIDRGLRIPPDGHFWSEEMLAPRPAPARPPPIVMRKG